MDHDHPVPRHGLTDNEVEEFVRIWKEEFGEELPLEEARIRAREIAELYGVLAGLPIEVPPSNDHSLFDVPPRKHKARSARSNLSMND